MALYYNYLLNKRIFNYKNCTEIIKLCRFYSRGDKPESVSVEVDALDDFTSRLMQKKTNKWETQKTKSFKLFNDFTSSPNKQTEDIDINDLNKNQLNVLFQTHIDNENNDLAIKLMNKCIESNKSIELSILIHILNICSNSGDKDMIIKIQKLCDNLYPQFMKDNSNFKHYLAQAIWVKGNISKSLEIFEEVYRNNAFLRRRIRLIFQHLLFDVVSSRSEAAVINIIKFCERLSNEYKDYFPLTCIWQVCFLSEWYTDQNKALDLLRVHEGLCKYVINRIPYVVTVSLRAHRTEVVYRLLEILLEFKMKSQYSIVLQSLLDFQFRRGDLRSCAEILQWSVENDVKLISLHHDKVVSLLINRHAVPKPALPKSEKTTPKTTYKF